LIEELTTKGTVKRASAGQSQLKAIPLSDVDSFEGKRMTTTMEEFDRVLGGGIVPGSVILLGGDPGIGKSTLMLQLARSLKDQIILYVSGEESASQIKLRAERLGFTSQEKLLVLTDTNAHVVAEIIDRSPSDILIVDSLQTMVRPELESSAGSIAQMREVTALFMRIAKEKSLPVFLIGHVTKEGLIAGPKVVEHMVDTVLQFEGDRHYAYRILRSMKNRFGSTNEIGIFQMSGEGLQEVKNPSEIFLSERSFGSSGSSVVASLEGSRPILLEVQALVTPTSYGVPQRNSTGVDYRRLGLLLAVLEKRLGAMLGQYDVFVNIAGGVRIDEPAVDLGISLAIISSLKDIPVDSGYVSIGEIGLGGEVRTVGHIERRVQEAVKLGFKNIILPKNNLKGLRSDGGISLIGVEHIEEAVNHLFK
jgi:DNA repair protein RadA/Sms